ncbi:MAG: 3-hydroxyacyl-CoA dehydrogenase family protein [Bacteriovoracaceae bacterium]
MFQTVLIIGSGTMGSGIAQWFAQQKAQVVCYDPFQEVTEKANKQITFSWNKLKEKGKFSEDHVKTFHKKLSFENDLKNLMNKDFDLVLEAVPEIFELKVKLFNEVLETINSTQIVATNTSSLSIDGLCAALPEKIKVKFCGIHFFNPAPIMKLVEIVKSKTISKALIQRMKEYFESKGKRIAVCKNSPGFIVNRVARNFYGEAFRIIKENNTEKVEEHDSVLQEVGGFRLGPFQLMDLIGIDVNLNVTECVWDAFYREPRFAPHPIQKSMVESGRIGKKVSKGFYKYD